MKSLSLKALAVAVASVVSISAAQAGVLGDGWNAPMKIFDKYKSDSDTINNQSKGWGGYRIPGIASTVQGTIIAVADKRFDGITGNTDIVANGDVVHKVWFSYKVSQDGGKTWSEEAFLKPPTFSENGNTGNDKYKNYITDPQIVHNPDTGTTFVFGYQSNTHVVTAAGKTYDLFMFSSQNGGLTWDEGQSLKQWITLGDNKWNKVLQGPGNGMYYNGTIYVPIQKWGNQNGKICTSGVLYSNDNGKTWHQSSWVIPDANLPSISGGVDSAGNPISSESTIFHHKGHIYLAAKDESPRNDITNRRIVWRANEDLTQWEQVTEDFIPHNIIGCETSTFALTDNVYFVGYTTGHNGTSQGGRAETWLTSNTGKRIKLYDSDNWNKPSFGYTSITSDLDNLYVLFEGADDNSASTEATSTEATGAMLLNKFDYAAKDYANLNGRLLRSAKDLRYIQDTLMSAQDTHIRGSFGDDSQYGAEAIFVTDKARLAVFHKDSKDLGDDVARTYAYDDATTSLILESSNLFFDGKGNLSDSLFGGYQYSAVDYANGADDEVHSIIAGYALNLNTDLVNYQFKINGKMSKHDFSRNNTDGLGKSAEFDSKVISITNELSKNFELYGSKLQARPFVGLDSTYFEHDGFSEQNGNGFNDITVHASDNWSHGLYVGAQLSGTYELNHGMSLDYSAKARYIHELSDIDDWTDSYTVFDTDFMFAAPVDKDDQENVFDASASVILNVNERVGFGIGANIDTANENVFFGQAKIKF